MSNKSKDDDLEQEAASLLEFEENVWNKVMAGYAAYFNELCDQQQAQFRAAFPKQPKLPKEFQDEKGNEQQS